MAGTKRGIFISFEGTEGSGKSTLIHLLAQRFREQGYNVVQTREPGGSKVAEKIRSILLDCEMNPWTEVFLYEAARAEHLAQTVIPALTQGDIVLCDRYADSTLAYQAYARGLPWEKIKRLNDLATQGIKPNLTLLLDIDPEVGLKRAQDPNRFEREGVEFQKKVRLGFLKAKREDPKRWWVVRPGSKNPDELAQYVFQNLSKRFKKDLKKGSTL